jgi:hypothetical protein
LIPLKEHNRVLKLLRAMAVLRLTMAVLYGSEGRLDLPFALAYVGIDTVLVLTSVFTVDPSLQYERWRPAPGGADLLPMRLVGMPSCLVHLVRTVQRRRFDGRRPAAHFVRLGALR